MRNKFDEMLDALNIELIKMGALCEEAITCAVKALLDKDNEMAEKTFRLEKSIDENKPMCQFINRFSAKLKNKKQRESQKYNKTNRI